MRKDSYHLDAMYYICSIIVGVLYTCFTEPPTLRVKRPTVLAFVQRVMYRSLFRYVSLIFMNNSLNAIQEQINNQTIQKPYGIDSHTQPLLLKNFGKLPFCQPYSASFIHLPKNIKYILST